MLMIVAAVLLLGCSTDDPYVPEEDPVLLRANRLAAQQHRLLVVDADDRGTHVYPNIENFLEGSRPALSLYREEITRSQVVEYFVMVTGSEAIALPILYYADRMDIPLSLAFSLAYVESRFLPVAVNYNHGSVDRGLFQLNSQTFSHLNEDDFFNPEVNAFYGLRYLEYCLETGADEAEALAIYNAGYGRVARGLTPPATLRYVGRVLEYRDGLTDDFALYMLSHFPPALS
jgi:hypothetical protein